MKKFLSKKFLIYFLTFFLVSGIFTVLREYEAVKNGDWIVLGLYLFFDLVFPFVTYGLYLRHFDGKGILGKKINKL